MHIFSTNKKKQLAHCDYKESKMSHQNDDAGIQQLTIPLPEGGHARIIGNVLHKYHEDGTVKSLRPLTDFEQQLLQFIQELPVVQSGNTRVYPGEPFFILTARDPQAPGLVERWAWDREHAEPGSPKIERAQYIAKMMRLWKTMNPQLGLSMALYPIKYSPKTLMSRLKAVVSDAFLSGLRVTVSVSKRANLEHPTEDEVQVLEVTSVDPKVDHAPVTEVLYCAKER